MQLCMLLEPQHLPLGNGVTEIANYGHESIICGVNRTSGTCVIVEGDKKDIANWLRQFGGVWITSNPMLGEWEVVHVKDQVDEEAEA